MKLLAPNYVISEKMDQIKFSQNRFRFRENARGTDHYKKELYSGLPNALQFCRLSFMQSLVSAPMLWPSTCFTLVITTMYVGQTLTGGAKLCELLHNSQLDWREFLVSSGLQGRG